MVNLIETPKPSLLDLPKVDGLYRYMDNSLIICIIALKVGILT